MVCGKIDDDGEENVEVVLEVCYCKRSRTCVATVFRAGPAHRSFSIGSRLPFFLCLTSYSQGLKN